MKTVTELSGAGNLPERSESGSVDTISKLGLIVGDGANESSYSAEVATATDGVISNRATGQPVANASVSALIAQPTRTAACSIGVWTQSQSGQPNPQVTGGDGKYSYSAGSGIYRIEVAAAGYQPYRSDAIDASQSGLAQNIALSPVINEVATQTIYITGNGYMPASVTVPPGSVIEFVNIDLDEHSSIGSDWDSGMLYRSELQSQVDEGGFLWVWRQREPTEPGHNSCDRGQYSHQSYFLAARNTVTSLGEIGDWRPAILPSAGLYSPIRSAQPQRPV